MERAQQTIVIHPGSSSIRVGRATDLSPLAIPSIVLRKKKRNNNEQPVAGGIETQTYVPGISRPETGSPVATTEEGTDEDEYHVNEAASQDPVSDDHGLLIARSFC
jgi:actin-related protein